MILACRLGDDDRAAFGGDEWLKFDDTSLHGMEVDELMALEAEMNISISEYRLIHRPRMDAKAIKVSCWLARKFSGDAELAATPWADFAIHPAAATVLRADASPPAGPPATSAGDSPTATNSSTGSGEATG